MSKSAATLETPPVSALSQPKRVRKPRSRNEGPSDSVALAPRVKTSGSFPAKPLLIGAGIGAALALTAVALGSRPTRSGFGPRPPSVAGALTKTAIVLLVRVVARKALRAAANQGARQLASAWGGRT